ncbi:MarR family winged helix-turn-helix transcriptional regulator [Fodinicola acaciae]|uniref:MarR family winged helix-turn-helix transcriptional regulator n=1 Tax=Fodinicola acaciae TaxID=2681555 RepID=UPI0013D4DFC0|nr:MarR family transcriptional regulator [Fodinicola acaciae]
MPAAAVDQDVAGRLRIAISRISHRLRLQAQSDDMTPTRLSALAIVAKNGPLRLGDLAARLGTSAPTMSRIVDWLLQQGLVDRWPDPDDQRAGLIGMADRGTAWLDEIRTRNTGYLAEKLAILSERELAALAAAVPVLERIAAESENS